MIQELNKNIYDYLLNKENVLLIGPTNIGKTWYVKNELIPFLKSKGIKVIYFNNPDFSLNRIDENYICIIDEFETLLDQDFLISRSKHSGQYYSEEYLNKVTIWHNNLSKLKNPSVFVLTRNNQEEIDYLIQNLKATDWMTDIKCLAFPAKNIFVETPKF